MKRVDKEQARVAHWITTHGRIICDAAQAAVRDGIALADLCILIYPHAGLLLTRATLRAVVEIELRALHHDLQSNFDHASWAARIALPVHPNCVRVFATRDGTEQLMFDLPLVAHESAPAPIDEAVRR